MQWQYRTILFEFTKDGLLGDKYVDDEEMEKTLNQMGGRGWELINVTLLQDGVLAFLKKPVQQERAAEEPAAVTSPAPLPPPQPVIRSRYAASPPRTPEPAPIPERLSVSEPEPEPEIEETEPVHTVERPRRAGTRNDDADFIGGIKIS